MHSFFFCFTFCNFALRKVNITYYNIKAGKLNYGKKCIAGSPCCLSA